MTRTLETSSPASRGRAHQTSLPEHLGWTAVSEKLWVGRRESEFAGIVEIENPGEYTAFDNVGHRVDTYYNLDQAQDALEPATVSRLLRSHRRDAAFMWSATASAVLAGAAGLLAVLLW